MNRYGCRSQGLLFFPAKALCLMEFSAISHWCGMSSMQFSRYIYQDNRITEKKYLKGLLEKSFTTILNSERGMTKLDRWRPCPFEFRNIQDEVPQPPWAAVPVQHWGREKNFSLWQNRISFAAWVHCFITFCCFPLRRFCPHPLHSPSFGSESSLISP